jgi:penicillin-insensitive murein endopeptidase
MDDLNTPPPRHRPPGLTGVMDLLNGKISIPNFLANKEAPASQAIGSYYCAKGLGCGRLVNPVRLDLHSQYYVSGNELRSYGTRLMINIIEQIGRFVFGLLDYRIQINAISDRDGGVQGGHASHQTGLDADISYLQKDHSRQFKLVVSHGVMTSEVLKEPQFELWQQLTATNLIDFIFVHQAVKHAFCQYAKELGDINSGNLRQTLRRLSIENQHDNHWHMRLMCTPDNPRCRKDLLPADRPGC